MFSKKKRMVLYDAIPSTVGANFLTEL